MAKSNKLQNVKAIKQMPEGTHKFQTRKTWAMQACQTLPVRIPGSAEYVATLVLWGSG